MRAHDLFNEDQFGTEPKRPARAGSRPTRGGKLEPRYKSAPVVPGGDNPDAVHVPNKGDEPVQRGDQVVVQDPDNIATVLSGVVKRIGREMVFVTLKNGETIAAPHDEVSKNYEVLSKRAHLILNKKGPSRSKYKVDEEEVLDEASYRDVIRELLDRFYKDVGLPPIQGNHLGILDIKSPGTRVWTRGDGVRHRDPGYILPSYWSDEPKKGAVVVQKFWQWLQTQPGVRPLGQISGEFSTSKFSNMVGYKGLYFAGGQRGVEFGSASRFKNPRSVWRHNPPNQGVAEGYKPRSKIEERLTSQDKFEKHLKKHGYDVNEKSKYWDQKVKDMEAQLAAWDEQMRQRKSNATTSEMASPGAVASKVTRIQGREYLLHSLPADMSKVKLVTDDSGKQVYVWVEKAGMRPQYTYYWFAPAQPVQEGLPALAGLTAAAIGAGMLGNYLDQRQPKVDIGGKQVMVVDNPGWGTIPSNAMTLTGKDGKQYKVWKGSGKGTSQWLATPAENVKESMCAKHISPSGAETTMCPDDDDYEINYGKDSGIDDFRKKNGLDVRTGKKVKEECAGVGIVTKQNSTADVGPGTIKKNLKAFNLEEILSELGVDKTLKFAKKAHGDQMYGDQPYWTHPRDVAAAGKRFFGTKFNNDAIKVAFLHDVVEDTPYKLKQLKNMGLSPEVIEAVELLTKNKALSYEENIKRIIASGNRLAMMVKYADNYKNYTGDKSSWNPKRAEKSQQKYQASLNMLGSKLGVDKHTQPIDRDAHVADMEQELEEWKASRQLCRSSTPDSELGASALASCKSQGLRARDGNKSHKVGNKRITVGGHRIKGKKYGGPLPDYGTRK